MGNTVTFVFPCGHTVVRNIDSGIKGFKVNGRRPILAIIPQEVEPYVFRAIILILHPYHSLIVYQGELLSNPYKKE
jgi:hypothetical protein